jgi:LAGLIDADG DNA endonuclease family protein/WhiA-like protein
VTAQDRDLVLALRAELAAVDPSRACDRRALAIAIGGADTTRDPVLRRLAIRLGLGSRRDAEAGRGAPGEGAADTGDDRTDRSGSDADDGFAWGTARDHCRAAYLRGLFLARGSLSLANGRTHLEFVVSAARAPVLTAHLAEEGLPAAWRIRRGRGVVTWKSAETIVTFLRRAGAGAALLELEARQVSRAMTGELNRVINAESANLTRAVEAAGRNLAAIEILAADGRLATQPYVVRLVADARRESPESTLGELAERLGVHRSAVQRALERVERLALHDDLPPRRRGVRAPRSRRRAGDPAARSSLA